MEGDNYFLYLNEFGPSVIRALKEDDIPTKPTAAPPAPPVGGAAFKTIEISAIFIQLLLLAELLMI